MTDIPANAQRLAKKAEQNGWTVNITPASAVWKDREVHSVAVRLRKDDTVAAGVWLDGAFDYAGYAHLSRRDDSPNVMPLRLNSRALVALVTA